MSVFYVGEEEPEKSPKIYVVKVPKGRGLDLLYIIQLRRELFKLPIYSALILDNHPDLIFVEADDYPSVAKAIAYFRYTRAFEEPLSVSEYEELMDSLKGIMESVEKVREGEELKFEIGQIVEIVKGPFKGKKARIVSVSKNKLFLDLMSGAMLLIEVKPEDVRIAMEEAELGEES